MRAILLVAVLVAAGCASAGASGPAVSGGAASVAPANVVSFVATTSDLGSKKWHGLGKLLVQQRDAVAAFADGEVDVATLPGGKRVTFVQPTDDAKLRAYAKQKNAVTRTFGAWTAIAQSTSILDAVGHAKHHLADEARYTAAMGAVPDNALARAYLSSDEAVRLFAAIPGQLQSQLIPPGAKYRFRAHTSQARTAIGIGIQSFRWLAAALTSESDGLRLEVIAARAGLVADQPPRLAIMPTRPYTAALLDEIPAGVTGIVDFQVAPGTFEQLPELPTPFRRLFETHDVTLPTELDAVLGGETAIYLRAGGPIPELTLVTSPVDTAAALHSLDSLVGESATLRRTKLERAVIGGQLVISTTEQGIAAFRAGGVKLSGDEAFLAAKKRSGMPDRTTGFAYANGQGALPLLRLLGVPVPADLPRLRLLAVYGGEADDRSTLTAFLGVG